MTSCRVHCRIQIADPYSAAQQNWAVNIGMCSPVSLLIMARLWLVYGVKHWTRKTPWAKVCTIYHAALKWIPFGHQEKRFFLFLHHTTQMSKVTSSSQSQIWKNTCDWPARLLGCIKLEQETLWKAACAFYHAHWRTCYVPGTYKGYTLTLSHASYPLRWTAKNIYDRYEIIQKQFSAHWGGGGISFEL